MDESPDALMQRVLRKAKYIAVVGASDKPQRAAFSVMKFLQGKGYRCIPVNPRLAGQKLLQEKVYASLAEVPLHIDIADIFVNPAQAGAIVDEAIAAGVATVWLQLGVIDEDAAERARNAGLNVVMDRCPAQEWSRLRLP